MRYPVVKKFDFDALDRPVFVIGTIREKNEVAIFVCKKTELAIGKCNNPLCMPDGIRNIVFTHS